MLCPMAKAQKPVPQNNRPFTDPVSLEFDEAPTFPGGIDGYNKFLTKNLKWPKTAIDAQGRVFVSFIIEKDGHLTNFKIEKSLEKDFDDEAIRVLKKMPRWTPAMKNGKIVRVRFAIPIKFMLTDQ